MVDLSTNYMGLKLKNPIIVGSSGLTKSVDRIKELEANGAGAVVLKSIFEEQIVHQSNDLIIQSETFNLYPEAADYIQNATKSHTVGDYLQLIKDAKREVKIPIIASINCFSISEWVNIAKDIENAGADALEINVFFLPSDIDIDGEGYEARYFEIIEKVKASIKIPIALKIGYYFSSLVHTVRKLSWTGVSSLVLFNRFIVPDINLESRKLHAANVFSNPNEINIPLRWIALLSDEVKCDISATTGIHDADGVIKQLLVGATTTQICSTIYINGTKQIGVILKGLSDWMERNNYKTIADFRGSMSLKKANNPVLFHRSQYMKHLFEVE